MSYDSKCEHPTQSTVDEDNDEHEVNELVDTNKNKGVDQSEMKESGSAKGHRQGSRSAAKGEDVSEESDDNQEMGDVHNSQGTSGEHYDTIISMN